MDEFIHELSHGARPFPSRVGAEMLRTISERQRIKLEPQAKNSEAKDFSAG
jgi:hypothetical protein